MTRRSQHASRGASGPTAAASAPEEGLARRKRVIDAMASAPSVGRRPVTSARVAVAADRDIRSGLAWEWDQVDLRPDSWEAGLDGAVLAVVEVDGLAVRGWPATPTAAEVAAAARTRGVPVVAWVTGPTEPNDAGDTIVDAFDAVFVANVDDTAAWRARWPEHSIDTLLPATAPRRHTPARTRAGAERAGEVLVFTDPSAADAPDDLVTIVAPAKPQKSAPVADVWERAPGEDTQATDRATAHYQILADVDRREPNATWPLLDAMATRTAVVTTSERAQRLPSDLQEVVAPVDAATVRRQVSVLVRQPEYRDRTIHVAQRAVLAGHTFADRARSLLAVADAAPPRQDRTVSVVVPTNRPHELPNILENAARQVRASTELIVVGHGITIDRADVAARAKDLGLDMPTVIDADASLTLGAVLNLGLDAASGAYVAKMDDDNFYGPDFLGDLLDVFTYTDAGITGKWAHYVWLRSSGAVVLRFERYEHTYHRLVQGGSILAHRDVAHDLRFSDIPRAVDSDFLNRAMAAGVRTYSGDRYNFVSIRGSDRTSHTWKVDDLIFMAGAGRVVTYGDPRDLVSV